MLRLLHSADLHPNSKATFAGKVAVDPETGKNLSLTDFRRSAEFLCLTALSSDTRVDAVLFSGDLLDSVQPSMDEVRVIVELVETLADEIPVVLISGNHDMGASGSMATALEPLKMRHNVHIMERPGSILLNLGGQPVRFFGLPYPSRGRLLSTIEPQGKSPEEVTALINHGLASILRSFAMDFEQGVPNVLLAHGSVSGAKVGEQPRSIANDIMIPLPEVERFTYTALGHIHQQQQVGPSAWYCGSLLRQSFGEELEYKGFNIVELCHGRPVNVQFVENPHARKYATLDYSDLEFYFRNDETLNPEIVWRLKDSMTPEQYRERKSIIDRLAESVPFFQVAVDLIEQDRARDASMSQMMSMDEALLKVLADVSDSEQSALLEKHHALVSEVNHAN